MDARIIKTKNKIKESLIQLLQTKKLNEVSISEICKKAKINRNTFYAHFATPEAALDEIAENYLSEEYALLNQCSTSKELVITACKYTKQNAKLNLLLLENRALKEFVNSGVEYARRTPAYVILNQDERYSLKEMDQINTFIVNGSVAIIKNWLYDGMKESPEEIGELVDRINTSLINGLNLTQKNR